MLETIVTHLPEISSAITGPGALVITLIGICSYLLWVFTPLFKAILPMLKEFFSKLTDAMEQHQKALKAMTETLTKLSREVDMQHAKVSVELQSLNNKMSRLEVLTEVRSGRLRQPEVQDETYP